MSKLKYVWLVILTGERPKIILSPAIVFIITRISLCQGSVPYILAGLKNIVRRTKNFVIWRFVKLSFHCSCIHGEMSALK